MFISFLRNVRLYTPGADESRLASEVEQLYLVVKCRVQQHRATSYYTYLLLTPKGELEELRGYYTLLEYSKNIPGRLALLKIVV